MQNYLRVVDCNSGTFQTPRLTQKSRNEMVSNKKHQKYFFMQEAKI